MFLRDQKHSVLQGFKDVYYKFTVGGGDGGGSGLVCRSLVAGAHWYLLKLELHL